ncbi:MAG: DEAD/DEAH box helicase [Candidatus Nanoarchaeia archaeon]|nr:DEAD/DEAH box helicase [Candidatus Nanoarchaeia archaeon]
METFRKLGICEPILQVIEEEGFEEPTEIQEKSIPVILEGKDIIAGASTGSGKTLAFGTRILQNSKKDFGIQALILTPTRELAEQISRALANFSKYDKKKIIAVYGGVSMMPQIEGLERAEIVVATPGRILDHLERGTINLQHVNMLVLDEADRMLDMGFIEDVGKIISQCPIKRQTLLYSATISNDIAHLAKRWLKSPVEVSAEPNVDPEKLTQVYYDVDNHLKFSLLKHLLENEKSKLVMVFCNTRMNVDFVANNLKFMGINALPIHGGFSQGKRNRVMEQFHSSETRVLVCTDVAARGLDIKGVTHIYNYDLPADTKEYTHRIGRTARAGEEGKVINIVTGRDYENFSNVLKYNPKFNIKREETPFIHQARIRWMAEKKSERNFRRRSMANEREGRGRGSRGNSRDSRGHGGRGPRRSFGSSGGRGHRDGNRRTRDNAHRGRNNNYGSRRY